MAPRKASSKKTTSANTNMQVGNIRDVSGEVNIAAGDIYKGFTAEQVSILIRQISTTFEPKKFDGRSPYKGLAVFEEEDAELFFGREKIVADLVSRIKESRTVFITGPSGSGKSSLVRAGLIHALKQGALPNSDRWLYATMKPGRDPFEALASAFSRLKSPELGDYFQQNVSKPEILHKCAEAALSERSSQRMVLFIDQFEEVFTQLGKETERLTFLNLLTHAAAIENGRVIILFSMRSDFVSNCATYPQLNALLNQQFVQIGAMQPDELVSAIAQPALRVGLKIDPDLIAQIINDMQGEPGALPLMQFALKDLFDAQQAQGGIIALTLNDYIQHGGIHKALERHADQTFATLNTGEQELARSIFSGLIEIGRGTQDTRRTANFKELIPANTESNSVQVIVRKLADARLITTDEIGGKDTVTISHEKLIDAWPWLKKLVNENRDVIALQNEIAADAKEWEEHQRDTSYLYSGARLATAHEKIKNLTLSESAQTFLDAGIKTEEDARQKSRRIQRIILTGSLIFSATVLGLLIIALTQLNASRAQQLGFHAQVSFSKQNYNDAFLYAYQSNLIHKTNAANIVLGQLPYQNFMTGKGLLGHTDIVTSVAWSADGRLASGSFDNTVIIWDLKTGQPAQTLKGHTDIVNSVAWSADGRLASGSGDNTVIIWDLKTGQPSQTLKGHTGIVYSVAWSADGRLASGSRDKTVIIWDLKTGQPAQTLIGHTDSIYSVAWSADGRLASGSADDTIIIWDFKTGQPAQILKGHTDWVHGVAWSADGRLASGSSDNTVIIWDLKTGQPAQTLIGPISTVYNIAWSADGQLASVSGSGDNSVIIWDLKTGQPTQTLKGHASTVYSVAWSADGRLASGSFDNTVIIWDLKTGQVAQTLKGHTGAVNSVAWSADGQLASGSADKTIIIWDLKTGQPAQTLKGHTGFVHSVAWSADGRLASGSGDNTVIIWDLKTGQPAQTLKGHTDIVNSVAWSADGQLTSGSADKTIIIWDLKTGQPAQTLKGHTGIVYSVAWSADGRLASGSGDNSVIIWDLKTGQPAQTLKGHTDSIYSVAWSADGRLASGSADQTVIIWDLKTGQPAQTLIGHKNYVNSVAWSADGWLASGSGAGNVIIWDLKTGLPAQTLIGHTDSIYSIAWSANGKLASGSHDQTIKIPRPDLISGDPCKYIMRNMSLNEWLVYQGPYFIYQPACPNLYNPSSPSILDESANGDLFLTTWRGRAFIFMLLLLLMSIVFLVFWSSYKAVKWIWRRVQARRAQQ